MSKSFYFFFHKGALLLEKRGEGYAVPYGEETPVSVCAEAEMLSIATLPDGEVKALSLDNSGFDDSAIDAKRYELIPLRQTYYVLSEEMYILAGKCSELLYWHSTTRYCGVCGSPMHFNTNISKLCPNCGREEWPLLATAIIVRITRGKDEILLAKARNFVRDFYGLIAGFVETGETLEQAVAREVLEETGLQVRNIKYFASQPWPYPCGLMVGFTAEYAGGTIHIQREELKEVTWFNRNHLPNIPEKLSIARRLIDDWIAST